jgi:Zn-dependent protease with chaperone function
MSMPSDPTVYEGRLSDGRTAATMRVGVRLAQEGLLILHLLPDGEPNTPLAWPYAGLRSGVPLHAGAPDVLLSLGPAGAETLFVPDPDFSTALLKRAGSLSTGRQRLAGLRPGAVFATLVAAIVGTVWYLELQPLQAVARLMPQQMRETMGRNVVTSLTGQMRVCETAPGRAALDRLTQRLLAAASDPPIPVQVVVVDWGLVNAFTAPGGQLILTRGLIETAGSPDEVAGVLAHELGHALELHPETGLIRALALGVAADLFFAGASGTTNLGLLLAELRYSRDAEREADAHAVRILKSAGVSSKGFADFFERLEPEAKADKSNKGKGDGTTTRLLTILSTHPLTKERVAMVRGQPTYPVTPALAEADWIALRQMCGTRPAPTPARRPGAQQRPSSGSQQPPGGSQGDGRGTNL